MAYNAMVALDEGYDVSEISNTDAPLITREDTR